MSPTNQTYNSLDKAFDFFNVRLFGGNLPACLITVQRHKKSFGYFSPNRFMKVGETAVTDEIALNPQYFEKRQPLMVLSTLVHEMVHLWQHHFGKSTAGYHNKQWASKMKEVGLYPSHTGEPGGRETGQQVTHYVIESGPFAGAVAEYLQRHGAILYTDRAGDEAKRKQKSASKTKYTCPGCDANAWAKPEAHIVCGDCDERMETTNS